MTKTEVVHFMQKIKAYYESFTMEDYKINEWYDKLKIYDLEDVYMKFDQHLQGEQKDYPPKLHYITRYLKTPEEKQKQKSEDYLIDCNLCGRTMTLSEHDKHYSKCSSIKYLQMRIKNETGNVISYDELDSLNENTFNRVYEKYKDYDDNTRI